MKEKMIKRIKELTSLIGVSGDEWDVSEYIYHELEGHVDELKQLNNGTIIAIKKGEKEGKRRIMAAHMDEVGYRINRIDPQGYAYFDAIGGATTACLPGRRMLVRGKNGVVSGIVGVRAGHLLTEEQKKTPQTTKQSYIDLCVSSEEEAKKLGVYIGASVVPDSECVTMAQNPDYLVTRAADCRVLCAVIIEILRNLKKEEFSGEICGVFTILEETTIRAISSPAQLLKPDYGLFLDTIPCGDVPDVGFEELPVALGKGPVLIHSQSIASAFLNVVSHPKLLEAMEKSSEEMNTPVQEMAFNCASYATDAVGAVLSGSDMAVVTLACPRRYSHSPVEVFHMNDVMALEKIVKDFMKKDIDLSMF